MKLQNLIAAEDVFLQLEASALGTALTAVADRVSPGIGVTSEAVVHALLERERLGSTSVGGGFAIPHCKLPGLKEISVSLARFSSSVDFGATDGAMVDFVFVVLSPPDQPAAHLQVLSQIARVLKLGELRRRLLSAPDPESTLRAIREAAEAEGL